MESSPYKRATKRLSTLETSFNRSIRILETPAIRKNNDEYERNSRRSLVQMQNSIAGSGSNEDTPQRNLDTRQLKTHLDICIKMNIDNTISVKNAWKLKIIDYMQTILKSNVLPRDTFQMASASLDASTKVYGIRVDDIYADGMQLASNMARAKNDENADESATEGAEGEGVEGGVENKKAQKKKKKYGSSIKATVAKDAKVLVNNVPKMESAFFQTQTNSNASLVDNLFTNKMLLSNCGCKFMLLNDDNYWGPPNASDLSLSKTRYSYPLEAIDQFDLCQDFRDFDVEDWDPENEDDGVFKSSFNADALILDDKGIPMAELDGSIQDIFDEGDLLEYATSDEEEECPQIAVQGEIASISHLSQSIASSEFAYNTHDSSRFMSQVWAGPSHWKLKFVQQAKSRFSGSVTEKAAHAATQKRAKTVPQPIDFTKEVKISDKKYAVKKRMGNTTDDSKYCFPRAHVAKNSQFISLLSKPAAVEIMLKKGRRSEVDENELSTYNYENAVDADYCANNYEDDDNGAQMEDGNDDICTEEDMAIAAQGQQYVGDNLIDLPDLVQKTQISYATFAKKMDMKKLKLSVWKMLVNDPAAAMEESEIRQVPTIMFDKVYDDIPNVLTKKMREELSCSLVFIAILHLANENNLKLTSQDDLKNFSIQTDMS